MLSALEHIEQGLRRALRVVVAPSPRGKIWRTAALMVVIGIFAGLLDYPAAWNRAAAVINPALRSVGLERVQLPPFWNVPFRLGLDLQGGSHLVYEADMKQIPDGDRKSALEGVRDVIERRVNAFGVSEPIVQTNRAGSAWRVIVELAGIKDVNEAIRQIGETPVLEFLEENDQPSRQLTDTEERELAVFNKAAKKKADDVLRKALATGADFAALAKEFSDDAGSTPQGGELGWLRRGQTVPEFDKALFDDLKDGQTTRTLVLSRFGYHIIRRLESRMNDESGTPIPEARASHILIKTKSALDFAPPEPWKGTGLTGKQLRRAVVSFDPTTNVPQVSLQFNDEGARLFGDITGRNINKPVAIFLDGQPLSTPTVQDKITGGQAVITGNFTIPEAKLLVQRLNAGALPVPITLLSQESVGATLGRDSLQKSLLAGLIGFALVALFMILYYRLPGLIAVLALGVYAAIVLAIFKLVPVTLTLAGIAGIVLSIGMAVDANVLIFERLKEELKIGKPLGQSLDEGFRRAWTSIRDGNLTTLISAAVLFWFSSSVIKGFALTLAIGVVVSMFSAITVSRSFLRLVLPWFKRTWWYGV